MQRIIAVRMRVVGSLGNAGFADWIVRRARRLSLEGGLEDVSAARVDFVVEGPEALVDAMEVACSLGPAGVIVDRIERDPLDQLPPDAVSAANGCTLFRHLPRS
jgi:acylphosphatase